MSIKTAKKKKKWLMSREKDKMRLKNNKLITLMQMLELINKKRIQKSKRKINKRRNRRFLMSN